MAPHVCRILSLTALAAATLLSACATTYDSAGGTYYSVWPFIGSRNPDLKLNYPDQNWQRLQLNHDPDPLDWISPNPPIDRRVWSPYSMAPAEPQAAVAAVSDNAGCATSCESPVSDTPLPLYVVAGDGQRVASR